MLLHWSSKQCVSSKRVFLEYLLHSKQAAQHISRPALVLCSWGDKSTTASFCQSSLFRWAKAHSYRSCWIHADCSWGLALRKGGHLHCPPLSRRLWSLLGCSDTAHFQHSYQQPWAVKRKCFPSWNWGKAANPILYCASLNVLPLYLGTAARNFPALFTHRPDQAALWWSPLTQCQAQLVLVCPGMPSLLTWPPSLVHQPRLRPPRVTPMSWAGPGKTPWRLWKGILNSPFSSR